MQERVIVDNVEALEATLARVKEAQKKYSTYTQEQVDKIFQAAAIAAGQASTHRIVHICLTEPVFTSRGTTVL